MRTQARARIASRRVEVAELLLQGRTYQEIAVAVKAKSTKTVHDDVVAVITEWQAEQKHNVSEWVALELSKVGRIESQAWAAWERSQHDAETVSTETASITIKSGRGRGSIEVPALQHKETRTLKGQVGEPRFLEAALKCVARRCQLLGLDAPTKIQVDWREEAERAGVNASEIFEEMVNEFATRLDGAGGGRGVGRSEETDAEE